MAIDKTLLVIVTASSLHSTPALNWLLSGTQWGKMLLHVFLSCILFARTGVWLSWNQIKLLKTSSKQHYDQLLKLYKINRIFRRVFTTNSGFSLELYRKYN